MTLESEHKLAYFVVDGESIYKENCRDKSLKVWVGSNGKVCRNICKQVPPNTMMFWWFREVTVKPLPSILLPQNEENTEQSTPHLAKPFPSKIVTKEKVVESFLKPVLKKPRLKRNRTINLQDNKNHSVMSKRSSNLPLPDVSRFVGESTTSYVGRKKKLFNKKRNTMKTPLRSVPLVTI